MYGGARVSEKGLLSWFIVRIQVQVMTLNFNSIMFPLYMVCLNEHFPKYIMRILCKSAPLLRLVASGLQSVSFLTCALWLCG